MRGMCEIEPERDVYGGGAGPTDITNTDGGARLTVAKGVVLHEACVGKTTRECRDGGTHELPPDTWEERDRA